MNSIIVLTDFSPAAEYAASYACTLAKQLNCKTIVLFNSFKVPVPITEALVLVTDEEAVHQLAMEGLKDLGEKLREILPQGVTIKYRADRIPLTEINTVAASEGAGLIVMGTAGRSRMEEMLMGSNVISVCRSSDLPVILVPPQMEIQPVTQIALACDMKDVEKTIPIAALKMVLDEFKVALTVLHMEEKDSGNDAVTNKEKSVLQEMLGNYSPMYNYIHSDDLVNDMIDFEKQHPSTLIVLLSKRHNFMEGLFYRSLTRQLAHLTAFPLLILREKHQ